MWLFLVAVCSLWLFFLQMLTNCAFSDAVLHNTLALTSNLHVCVFLITKVSLVSHSVYELGDAFEHLLKPSTLCKCV